MDQVGESVAKRTTRAVCDVVDKMKLSSRGNSYPAVPWPACVLYSARSLVRFWFNPFTAMMSLENDQ